MSLIARGGAPSWGEFGSNVESKGGGEGSCYIRRFEGASPSQRAAEWLGEAINLLGALSAKEQGLSVPITTAGALEDPNSIVYLILDKVHDAAIGFLRLGVKHLYIWKEGNMLEVDPLCVLDFYVHYSYQRRGLGKKLFQAMLDGEKVKGENIAYDRPSDKLEPFLSKHFGLDSGVLQPNRYLIFLPKEEETMSEEWLKCNRRHTDGVSC